MAHRKVPGMLRIPSSSSVIGTCTRASTSAVSEKTSSFATSTFSGSSSVSAEAPSGTSSATGFLTRSSTLICRRHRGFVASRGLELRLPDRLDCKITELATSVAFLDDPLPVRIDPHHDANQTRFRRSRRRPAPRCQEATSPWAPPDPGQLRLPQTQRIPK